MAMLVKQGKITTVVGMLTQMADGRVELRLHGQARPPVVELREPTALEYAELRTLMREVDRTLDDEFPTPDRPVFAEGASEEEQAAQLRVYAVALSENAEARNDAVRDVEKPRYAMVIIEVIRKLSGRDVTLAELPVEAFRPQTCGALLEAWETPLGGPDEIATETEPDPVPAAVPDAPTPPPADVDESAPDSTASEGS